LLDGQSAIPEDFVKQAGADGLARMRLHNRAAATLVTQEVMAAFDSRNAKAALFEGAHRLALVLWSELSYKWCEAC
jgi:hypothetical protein